MLGNIRCKTGTPESSILRLIQHILYGGPEGAINTLNLNLDLDIYRTM